VAERVRVREIDDDEGRRLVRIVRNADGFASLYPKYRGGRPPKFTLVQRREIKKIAKSRPAEHALPFSTWSLSKLAEMTDDWRVRCIPTVVPW
jgi:transposase